jgi:transaldolase/glucose-6-phosphate isomerase
LVDEPAIGLAVPETDNSFDEIISAQSAGDHQALVAAGRDVVRIDVGDDPVAFVRDLTGRIT